jgi:hypothetical protein
MALNLFHFADHPFWKVDGTLNGLVTAVLDRLQPGFCFSMSLLIDASLSFFLTRLLI